MDKVTDKRQPGFFIIDNEILDDYRLDEIQLFLYCKISRHSNRYGRGYFSLGKLKKLMRWGNTTVADAIKVLVGKNLILADLKTGLGYSFEMLPVIKKNPSSSGNTPPTPSSSGNDPSPTGRSTLPPTGNKEDLTKEKNIKEDGAPGVDFQESPPAHEEVYKNIYQGGTVNQEGGRNVEPKRKSDRYSYGGYSFEKTPNLEGAAIFKRMAKHGAPDDGENSDSNPGYKLNCMKCGIQTTFPDKHTALVGNCKKCGKPIFPKEEKVK